MTDVEKQNGSNQNRSSVYDASSSKIGFCGFFDLKKSLFYCFFFPI
jgi:hypothetical protein